MQKIITALKEHYKTNLLSIYSYGYPVKDTTVHLLIILNVPPTYTGAHPKFNAPKHTYPIQYTLFTQEEISHSLDVFPMEFLAIQTTKTLLYGPDILTTPITHANLRHEIEYTLRTTILKLREAHLTSSIPPKQLIDQSISTVLTTLSGILHLKNLPPQSSSTDLIHIVETTLSISLSQLHRTTPPNFNDYLHQLNTLTTTINSLA